MSRRLTCRLAVNSRIDAFWLVVTALVLALWAYLVLNSGISLDRSGQRSELLGLSPLVGHIVAVVGMIAAIIVALSVAAGKFTRGGKPAGKDETVA